MTREEFLQEFNDKILLPVFFEWRGKNYNPANLEEDWKRFCDIPEAIRIKMILEYKPTN